MNKKSKVYKYLNIGWVYCVNNPCLFDPSTSKQLCKIGFTSKKDPNHRIRQLNKCSAIPFNFQVVGLFKTPANKIVEKLTHKYFSSDRVNSKKEFFKSMSYEVSKVVPILIKHVDQNSFLQSTGKIDDQFIYDPVDAKCEYRPVSISPPEEIDAEKWSKINFKSI